ncbi:MAG TPA: IPT/TIG domain-containing protein [Thermoanaerobaculia bacterium]
MRLSKSFTRVLIGLAFVAAAGCQSDSPTEPTGGGPIQPVPPIPVTQYIVTVTANPPQLAVGATAPSIVTVQVRRADNGQAPPDLTDVTITTSLGEFGSAGSGLQTTTVDLVNGQAQVALFPGTGVGTATIRAEIERSAGVGTVQIGQAQPFFISSIQPGVGSPAGGEEVRILGGGFEGPVRVTFNGIPVQVLSVSPTQIRVRTPSATQAGINVPVGQAVPVNVGVTINVNEANQASDSLANGFTYAQGGGIQQPVITGVTPTSGTNDGGTPVRIIGDGFQAPMQVFFGQGDPDSFNGVEATVQSVTRNEIVVLSPAARGFGQNNLNQLVNILVRNTNTGFSAIRPAAFQYGSRILITAMGPGSGSYLGGTRVTIQGQGFDEPVAVSLGGIGQQVISVTGTQIVFITSGVRVSTCPANGIVEANGVSVTNIETGDTATAANLGFDFTVPLPVITGVNPNSGSVNSNLTISGVSFAQSVQVLFGDPANGSSAPIVSQTGSSIVVRVPTPPQGFAFATEPCDGNNDGIAGGTRNIPTPISVTVRNLDGTGCAVTLSNAFTLNPPNTTCANDNSVPPPPPPTQCTDGFDNDSDGLTDAADPQCTGPTDNSEST